ncbi:MAG: toll/interleukin-1 receptor domain-containing protein [Thermoanaerobaculia bacterium]
MLPKPDAQNPCWGIHELTTKGNNIQIVNIGDMLNGRDLLLLDFFPDEAEWILNLPSLVTAGEKIINYTTRFADDPYWSRRGVLVRNAPPETIIDRLAPANPEGSRYGAMDVLVPRGSLLDMTRPKRFDTFMSYFSGDADFARRLEHDLGLREINIWRDEHEIEIGDSLSAKIQEGLQNSYSMLIVLSPEALSRPWVNEELRAAYALRLGSDFKIFPVLHKECTVPLFLADYRYADFRDENRYDESLALLERSIKNTVRRALEKK